MQYEIRKAMMSDLNRIEEIYSVARTFMIEHNNPSQWGNTYPPHQMLLEDVDKGFLYVIEKDHKISGVFYFYIGPDPCYDKIENGQWRSNTAYGTIHRIASNGSGGIFQSAVMFCLKQISHLRIDTHEDNYVMQRALEKHGFSRRGIVYMEDGTPRIGYDLLT